jgi:acyl-homoserine lactone acylase PvdQ
LRRNFVSGLIALAVLALPATAAAQADPFGTDDAGGFRNVLPPGEAGVDNVAQLGAFLTAGSLPAHWDDQQPLYDGLVAASASKGFGMSDVNQFYKDATFGVPDGGVESTISPRPGVTIVRDSAYGIPHVYGQTRDDVMFGAGYVNAADRLFLMDILRHTGRAQLSSFVGGSASNRAMDRAQWQFAPYTEEDLQQQVDNAQTLYGHKGAAVIADVRGYVDGINAYISEALADPSKLPGEYAALGKLPEPWTVTDTVAEASLIGGIFGKGGGRELDSALTMQDFLKRFGDRVGRRAWADFRSRNDPEAPTTIKGQRFPYETGRSFAKKGLAIPDPGTVTQEPVAPPLERPQTQSAPSGFGDIGAQLRVALQNPGHASNWELVSGAESQTGHPIGVLGPQVGYYQPQILMEEDLHGPGIDARGATFPGVGLYVLLDHGRDYAWSATTATSDNVDTFAEVLCQDDFHYRYNGECLPMEKLERTNTWTPNGVDSTEPGSETLTAYRTVHGIVFARGLVHRKKVAYVLARSTYFHEADSALFFRRMNDPGFMKGGCSKSFLQAVKSMNFLFNWACIDHDHIAYEQTGWMPRRASGTSPDFPILGTGEFDWKGYDPDTHTGRWLPARKHPQAVDPPYLVSWNNKQAPGWAAADDVYTYGSIHRSQLIEDRVRRGIRGDRKMSLPQLVQAMEEPATQDLRAVKLLPLLVEAMGNPKGKLGKAVRTLERWRASGAHRRDLDGDGTYEDEAAVELMDAWWPLAVEAQFRPELGGEAYDSLVNMASVGAVGRSEPAAPDYFAGWYGYMSKDLRTILGEHVRGAYSRTYCGRGSLAKCRKALRNSLKKALKVTPQELYGFGDCESDPDAQCYDLNRATVASGIELPPGLFQNRPTFQQTASVRRDLP